MYGLHMITEGLEWWTGLLPSVYDVSSKGELFLLVLTITNFDLIYIPLQVCKLSMIVVADIDPPGPWQGRSAGWGRVH